MVLLLLGACAHCSKAETVSWSTVRQLGSAALFDKNRKQGSLTVLVIAVVVIACNSRRARHAAYSR
jgi:hypothetical protein